MKSQHNKGSDVDHRGSLNSFEKAEEKKVEDQEKRSEFAEFVYSVSLSLDWGR
ncbi:hypothetical protein SLEP1_g59014 [Rubroshorea leprosula]|uniref:Uncharacterized protein n=1 Tax=Rubroshorea leprosula TaxID=152421 RepID=A0AAV5MV80_9ROSI|nr:hypothetical protein SLEP1_g59014 [Rubroshorea leprosula]